MRFPFYNSPYDIDTNPLKNWEINKRAEHAEKAKYANDYRINSGFDKYARRGMKIHNVVQIAKPTDEVSRIFLGLTRSVIDRGHEQITEGDPGFMYAPRGPSDSKKVLVWEKLVENILSDCNYHAHQNLAFRDLLSLGSMVFEQYCDYPTRTVLVPNSKHESGYEQVIVRDYTKPSVGVRQVNPLDAWRNPNITDPTQVPSCWKRDIFSWNQFAQDFGNAVLSDDSPKYKNCMKIQKGSHVAVFTYQDEITGEYAKYAYGFGNEEDGYMNTAPELSVIQTSIPICYKPLKIHEVRENGIVKRSDGLNIPGICSLRWGTYFDLYDNNLRGTHSVYGMGMPQRLEAEDMTFQTLFNVNLDNVRWANTVALNYEGNNADSYLDLDANRLYGGEVIDGKITPQPLGISRIGDYQAMKQDIEESLVAAVGVNPRALLGDPAKTAFEMAQRQKMASRSAEQLLSRLENEVFKPLGRLILAGTLSDLTVKEYEDMTEEQVDIALKKIRNKEALKSDYEGLDSEEPKQRYKRYVRMEGYRKEEDLSSGKRRFDFSTDDTLKIIPSNKNDVAFIPLEEEYIVPAQYIERGLLPDVTVDTKRMLGDRKAQDAQNMKILTDFISQLAMAGLIDPKKINWDMFVKDYSRFAGMDEDKVMTPQSSNKKLDEAKAAIEQMLAVETSPDQNAQLPPQTAPTPTLAGLAAQPSGQGGASQALQGVANGTL